MVLFVTVFLQCPVNSKAQPALMWLPPLMSDSLCHSTNIWQHKPLPFNHQLPASCPSLPIIVLVFQLCNTHIVLTDVLALSAVAVVSKSMGLQSVSQSLGLVAFTVLREVYQDRLECMLVFLPLIHSTDLGTKKHIQHHLAPHNGFTGSSKISNNKSISGRSWWDWHLSLLILYISCTYITARHDMKVQKEKTPPCKQRWKEMFSDPPSWMCPVPLSLPISIKKEKNIATHL